MTPSLRRCILAVALMGGTMPALETRAQQSASPAAPPNAAAKPAPAKAAAKKDAAKAAPKTDPAAAQASVEAGIDALGQGRADAAVASLTSALSASSLPQNQTARALYYRGVAYRRQAKPAQAISDLTNSLWIKGGLTEGQRQDALQQRSGAYREAGLPDQGDPAAQRVASGAKAGSASAPFSTVAPSAPNGSSTSLSPGGGFFSSLFGGTSPAPEAQPAPAAIAPATTASVTPSLPPQPGAKTAAARTTGAQPVVVTPQTFVQTQTSIGTTGTAADGQSTKPATRLVPVLNNASSLPTGFQDIAEPVRMVEVSTQARAQQPDPAASAAVTTTPDPRAKSASVAGTRASAKAAGKTAAVDQAASPQQMAAASHAAAAAPAPRAGAGGVRIQVAAVRTAEEAQGLSTKLQSQYARELGGRAPVVDQVSAGNFGNFYRVQVGPFAPTRETDELCQKLKADGLDCRLVSQ